MAKPVKVFQTPLYINILKGPNIANQLNTEFLHVQVASRHRDVNRLRYPAWDDRQEDMRINDRLCLLVESKAGSFGAMTRSVRIQTTNREVLTSVEIMFSIPTTLTISSNADDSR